MNSPEPKSNLQLLLAQQVTLNKQIADTRNAEKAEVITKVRTLIADFGITSEELFATGKMRKKAAIKFKDPVSGALWSGRGRAPKWFDAATPEKFAV